jgi:hypothetical protein
LIDDDFLIRLSHLASARDKIDRAELTLAGLKLDELFSRFINLTHNIILHLPRHLGYLSG